MKKKIFVSDSIEAMPLSRSKIDLFLQCPRCFYLDRKLGISQPSGAPFTLNNAVDAPTAGASKIEAAIFFSKQI